MRFVMVGAGAVGGTLGARLFAAGHDVVLIARGAHGSAIAERGLRFGTPEGYATYRIPVAAHPGEIAFRPDDVVFLSVKSQHTAAALADLAAVAPPGIHVVCAQNGVENERLALRLFANVHGMCVKVLAVYLEPGVVLAHGTPRSGMFDLGRFPRGIDEVDVAVAAALDGAHCLALADPDVMRRKYAKLIANANNALEAACGRVARDHPLRGRIRDEAVAVLDAAGIAHEVPPDDDARIAQQRPQPVEGLAHAGNSTWQSFARGAGSIEVDELNGEIVLLGRLHGIAAPVNAALQRIARRMLREGLAPGAFTPGDIEREAAAPR